MARVLRRDRRECDGLGLGPDLGCIGLVYRQKAGSLLYRLTDSLHSYGASLYPRPRTVSTCRGSLGSCSILVRSLRTWTSTNRPSPK